MLNVEEHEKLPFADELSRKGILKIAETLHMLSNGSQCFSDFIGRENYLVAQARYLEWRLENWSPSTSTYDHLVRCMAQTALNEYRAAEMEMAAA